MRNSPLHLYVHIPFCIHKCPYCDFNSHVRQSPPWTAYQQALLRELAHWSAQRQYAGRPIQTVFFGGGTPSLAPPSLIQSVLETAALLFPVKQDAEITLEANPGTAEAERFANYRNAGINRLSMGVQSFDDKELKWLERIHSGHEAIAAYNMARNAGFEQISLDLMYGLPDQSIETWMHHLEQVVSLAPEHVSCYQLTVEPHTQLAIRHKQTPFHLPGEDLSLDFLMQTRERLAQAGYAAYEISNFSKPGMRCHHNDGYWQYHDYIGIGAGAAGKWDRPDSGIIRYSNMRSPEAYIKSASEAGSAINSREQLSAPQAAAESVWLGLRRTDGISRHCFNDRFGCDIHELFASSLDLWEENGCVERTDTLLKLTAKGLGLADSIAASVLQTVVQKEEDCQSALNFEPLRQ
ncbi:MAG: radical SAM family heme chaperone HemW [Mariprofundaceae bacterium]|nr:radical SAM family heme chaperone HemW [Mariprofundaceae bacterium]